MRNEMLLESIWQGEIVTTQTKMCKEVSRLLRMMVPLQTVCLSAKSGVKRSCIISENLEVMPAIPLGDILAEELSADVPLGSLIVILKEQNLTGPLKKSEVSFQLGLLVGDALLDIIGGGTFPLHYEAEALEVMENSYYHLIESDAYWRRDICPRQFRAGLTQSLNEYWKAISGPSQKGCCGIKPINGRRKVTTPWLERQNTNAKSVNLAHIQSKVTDRSDWKKIVIEAVMSEIRADAVRAYYH